MRKSSEFKSFFNAFSDIWFRLKIGIRKFSTLVSGGLFVILLFCAKKGLKLEYDSLSKKCNVKENCTDDLGYNILPTYSFLVQCDLLQVRRNFICSVNIRFAEGFVHQLKIGDVTKLWNLEKSQNYMEAQLSNHSPLQI